MNENLRTHAFLIVGGVGSVGEKLPMLLISFKLRSIKKFYLKKIFQHQSIILYNCHLPFEITLPIKSKRGA
jgi:hypothetical protein